MHICVVGWYYEPEFIDTLKMVNKKYPVTIVSHKRNKNVGIPTVETTNVGLEWGAYSYYLQNVWDGDSVFFTHDDNKVMDVGVFDRIAEIDKDCSMIFRTAKEGRMNMGVHGRAFFCSEKFLKFYKDYDCKCRFTDFKSHKGFWYDPVNFGMISDGGDKMKNVEVNRGTYHMKAIIEKLKEDGSEFDFEPTVVPDFYYGFRGKVGIDGLISEIGQERYQPEKNFAFKL